MNGLPGGWQRPIVAAFIDLAALSAYGTDKGVMVDKAICEGRPLAFTPGFRP